MGFRKIFILMFIISACFSSLVFASELPDGDIQTTTDTPTEIEAENALSISEFKDVVGHWATDAIKWGLEQNVMSGYGDGIYGPDKTLTEAEFATMFARYASNVDKDEISKQVFGGHWSTNYYGGLDDFLLPLRGYTNDNIKDAEISRGQIAQVIAAKYGFNLSMKQAVYFMYENELSIGNDANLRTYESYGYAQSLTRAQAVTFMQRIDAMENKTMTFKGQTSIKGQPKDNKEILGIVGVPVDNSQVDFADFGMMGTPVVGSGITTKVGADGKVYVEMNKITTPIEVEGIRGKVMNYFDFDSNNSFSAGSLNNSIAKYNGVELPINEFFSTAEYMNDGGLVTVGLNSNAGKSASFTDKEVFLNLMENMKYFKASSAQITKAKEIVNTWYGKSNSTGTYLAINSNSKQSSMLIHYGDKDIVIYMYDTYGIADGMGDVLNVE